MPLIQNAKGVQFWKDVNARLQAVGKTVDEIHYVCPELAISTLKKWQSKGALPASEHICLIKSCLDQWAETQPEQVNEIQAGENPMVLNTDEVEKLKEKIKELTNTNRSWGKKLYHANKRIVELGGKAIEGDFEEPSDSNERINELEETIQARDIEIEEMRKRLSVANEMYNKVCESTTGVKIGELQDKIAELQQKLQEAQENSPELAKIREELADAYADIERIEGDLMNAQELLKGANEEVERIQAIAKGFVDELSSRNMVIDIYEREKQSLIRQIEVLNEQRGTATKPNYYIKGGIECKDLIAVMLTDVTGINAFYLGNALKYLWRWQGKNGAEDLAKAITYLEDMKNGIVDKATEESEAEGDC